MDNEHPANCVCNQLRSCGWKVWYCDMDSVHTNFHPMRAPVQAKDNASMIVIDDAPIAQATSTQEMVENGAYMAKHIAKCMVMYGFTDYEVRIRNYQLRYAELQDALDGKI